jgi:hypothetical protein
MLPTFFGRQIFKLILAEVGGKKSTFEDISYFFLETNIGMYNFCRKNLTDHF